MDWWFYFTIIIGLSLLYYGHENKKKYELKRKTIELEHELEIKKMELEQKRMDLEMKQIENGLSSKNPDNDFEKTV
jgi:hypothetical protein